jgi:hypothetical protein
MSVILNIAGGKINPIYLPKSKIDLYKDLRLLINLDQIYLHPTSNDISIVINNHSALIEKGDCFMKKIYCNYDIYDFLERYHLPFDGIAMYRFLEHVSKVQVLYFIYLLSTVIKIQGYVDIIVPDYKQLARRILDENTNDPKFEAEDIITTFELLNEPNCPHASIWTKERLIHFFELEGRFKCMDIRTEYQFDGRDIYIRAIMKRIK